MNPVKYPIALSREEEARLLLAYQRSGDLAARDRVVLSCMPFVVKVAHAFLKRCRRYYDETLVDDLIQQGAIHLLKSCDKWESARGLRFMTFVGGQLWFIFKDYLLNDTLVTRAPQRNDMSPGLLRKWLACECVTTVQQPDGLLAKSDKLWEVPESLAVEEAEQFQVDLAVARGVLRKLPDKLRGVLERRCQGHKMREIAYDLGVTKSRVGQLELEAKAKCGKILAQGTDDESRTGAEGCGSGGLQAIGDRAAGGQG